MYGNFFAPNLTTLQFFIALEGAGSIVISIVAAAFVADSLPPEKRVRQRSGSGSRAGGCTSEYFPI